MEFTFFTVSIHTHIYIYIWAWGDAAHHMGLENADDQFSLNLRQHE